MKWLSVISFIIFMTTVCCSSVILTTPQNIRVEQGGVILLKCQYDTNRTDSSQIGWFFVDHNVQVSSGKKILIDAVDKYSFVIPQDQRNQLNLQIHNAQASDKGHYTCSNKNTADNVTHTVFVNTVRNPLVPIIPFANFSECCKAENVSSTCLPSCIPSSVDSASFNPLTACAFDLDKLLKCFSDGRNHVACCRRRHIPEVCLDFCLDHPPSLNADHLQCLNKSKQIISCFEEGQVYLPSYPREVSALAMSSSSVLVNWKQPAENFDKLNGYRVFYRNSNIADIEFQSTDILPPVDLQYRITGLTNMKRVTVYVIALTPRGSSVPSNIVDIALKNDAPVTGQDKSIRDCCVKKEVGATCQTLLCQAKTWTRFDPDAIIGCYGDLDNVFTCLAGERNHSDCCVRNKVNAVCLPLCGGSAPMIDASLIRCVTSLPVIEACVQEGLETIVGPPKFVRVMTVGWNSAVLEWDAPEITPDNYIVQYWNQQTGDFIYKDTVTSTYIDVDNLTPETEYEFRIISHKSSGDSLPSESVKFLTYDKPDAVAPTQVTAVEHNISACCINKNVNAVCRPGCNYTINLFTFFSNFSIAAQCYNEFDNIISCGSDGRDHTPCCQRSDVPKQCQKACNYTEHTEPLTADLLICVQYISTIQNCFKEGVETLPKHPSSLSVIGQTQNTISITWSAPITGPTVNQYLVKYYNILGNIKIVEVNQTSYIMQDLMDNTKYTFYVISVVNGTTSPASVTLQQWTLPGTTLPPLQINGTDATGTAIWANRTDCCQNIGINADCLGICLNQNLHSNSSCYAVVDKALACAADGRNHEPCCQRKGVPSTCQPFCGGKSIGNSFQSAACLTYITDITSCFIEGVGLVPGQPQRMTVTFDVKSTTVTVKWLPPVNCDNNCQYDLHYWPVPYQDNPDVLVQERERIVKTIQRVKSPYLIRDLNTHGIFYKVTVAARNVYGGGQPSPIQIVTILNPVLLDLAIAQSPNGIISEGDEVKLFCDYTSLTEAKTTWFDNSKRIISNQKIVKILNVTEAKSGIYTCEVTTSAGEVTATHFLKVMSKPVVTKVRERTVSADQGLAGGIFCTFHGFPKVVKWMKDNKPLDTTISRLSAVTRTRKTEGLLIASLKISNVRVSDYGTYQCNGTNIYGSAAGIAQFKDPDTIPPVTPSKPPKDIIECCRDKKLSAECMDICDFKVDLGTIFRDSSKLGCLQYLTVLVQCGADGRDHTKCCAQNGTTPFCQPLCSGVIPTPTSPFENIMQCISQATTILGCAEEGKKFIPKAPYNVTAVFTQKKIIVRWSESAEGMHRVDSFKIYYSHGNETNVISTSKTVFSHDITDIVAHNTYTVWVIAFNSKGTSLPSKKITVVVTHLSFSVPRDLKFKLIDETTVELTWKPPEEKPESSYTYHVFYKQPGEVATLDLSTKTLMLQIKNLPKGTTYVAYVVAMESTKASEPSNTVTFTTGGTPTLGKQGGSNGAAIGVGIVVALVVVAIVAILVFIFIRRKRQQSAETVAFENPNYGNEKIQISGLNGDTPQHGFDYARLDESQTHEYQTVQPNLHDNSDTNNAAAMLPVDTMQIHPSMHMNESGEI